MNEEYSLKEMIFDDEVHKKQKKGFGYVFAILLPLLQFMFNEAVVMAFLQVSAIAMVTFIGVKLVTYDIAEKRKVAKGDLFLIVFCIGMLALLSIL
ncbi:hypothetical protein NC661_04200 [Aquibacillus koreensis]|uniref:DUF4181 domain-containing protein n=1 Tax=Aquibacillus koreensis TaxID=279446 RepID=A0A9X3WLI4_9BACI|nr:hypothetical protein [Aquibacillus koreensis]MCT2534825.1 hypothetical protein [Aquibacillus koreensis]MDC3419564.1 hypothetical protein [Aquibacillus koreensis]